MEFDTAPSEAMIVVVPVASALARPVLLTVARFGADEFQVAIPVMSWLVPSVKVPVAVNCCTVPAGVDGSRGVITMDATTAGVTDRVSVMLIEPETAVMVTFPRANVVSRPLPSINAIVGSDESHVMVERVCVLPSVNVPTAVNCTAVPRASVGFGGFRLIDTRAAGSTVNVVVPATSPEVALMVTVPTPSVAAVPVPSMDTIVGSDETQVALAKFWFVPSLKIPVATNSCPIPCGTEL